MRRLAKGLWHVAGGATFDPRKLFDPALVGRVLDRPVTT